MKKRKIVVELNEGDEVIEREVKKFGNSGHVIIPDKHIGKKAKIICHSEEEVK